MTDEINIADINKGELLAGLYNNARPVGMGFMQSENGQMTAVQAEKIIQEQQDKFNNTRFDYLKGRPIKLDIGGDTLDPWLYERDHGLGTVAEIVQTIRDNPDALKPDAQKTTDIKTDFSDNAQGIGSWFKGLFNKAKNSIKTPE